MASNPIDILSVAEFKRAVRFVGDDSHDFLIETHIRAALSWIDEKTACGVLDRTLTYHIANQRRSKPVSIPIKHSATLSNLTYAYPRADDTSRRIIAPLHITTLNGRIEVEPPAGTWEFSNIDITGTLSIEARQVPPPLKSAAILLARRLYDGEDIDKGDWAVTSLIAPYLSQSRAAPDILTSTVDPTENTQHLIVHNIRVGWSNDTAFTAMELTREGKGNSAAIPDASGAMYLGVWRADSEGGAPSTVKLGTSNRDRRNDFGIAAPLVFEDIQGHVIATVFAQNAQLLSGTKIEVE